ncbi:hypothetical protein EDD21DRAFT_442389, partial [Dissophora ornata]
MLIWAVAAGVSGVSVGSPKSKAVTGTTGAPTDASAPGPEPAVAAPEPAVATPELAVAAPEMAAAAATASTPATETPQEIANGSAASGEPNTPEEEKADSVLSCMDGCTGNTECQNGCIASGYNVNLSSVPPVISATVSSPVSSTSTGVAPTITTTSGGAVATPTSITSAHGSSAIASNVLGMQKVVGAIIAVGAASMFV